MMYLWAGKILFVDLTEEKTWVEPLKKELCPKFLGGRGINAKLLWDLTKPGIDPLSPENLLIFGSGSLTGTTAPSSGRTTVTCKSPATKLYLKTSMGGHFGAEMKFAGYDHLVVLGASKKPKYLWVNDGEVEIRNAEHLWGKNVREMDGKIKDELGDEQVKIAGIGPSGEKLVKFAAVMNSIYNAAGRGGAGAVMGSKMLKAIAVRGTGDIKIKEPEKFLELTHKLREGDKRDVGGQRSWFFGTAGNVHLMKNTIPSYNYLKPAPDGLEQISGAWLVMKGFLKRRVGCYSCTRGCHRYTEIDEGPYAGLYTVGPEYETFSALGSGTGVVSTEDVIKANDEANIMGLDTISVGQVIQWAMECYEKGLLTKQDTNGLELNFGNSEALIKLIPMIANREGKLGDLLADGVLSASKKIGGDSYKWAIANSKGLEQSRVDTRINKSYALAFAVNPRGPDHLHTECIAAGGATPRARELMEEATGHRWPEALKYVPEIVRWHEDTYTISDCTGFCAFVCTAALAIQAPEMAELINLGSGIKLSKEEIMLAGRRVLTLEKCFNVREGADRKYDDLPWRMMNEPVTWEPFKGMVSSKEWLDGELDKYYALQEWDPETSWPYKETLLKLGLEEVEADLEKRDRCPSKK